VPFYDPKGIIQCTPTTIETNVLLLHHVATIMPAAVSMSTLMYNVLVPFTLEHICLLSD